MNDRVDELEERIAILENENKMLRETIKTVADIIGEVSNTLDKHLVDYDKLSRSYEEMIYKAAITEQRVNNMPYELKDAEYRLRHEPPKIMSVGETRKQIIEQHKSIARLGDGEFAAIAVQQRWLFQRADERLGKRLAEVLSSDEEGLLIGLIPFYGALSDRTEEQADGVRAYLTDGVRAQHAGLLKADRMYANSEFKDIKSEGDVRDLKAIWDDRDCLFIEGEKSRLGVGNDLFENCRSIRRIICPAENAFDRYDDILTAALGQKKDLLVLIALGPTATVLAYDLFHEGYWAIDLGHADLNYDKYRNGDVRVSFKYDEVNLVRSDIPIDDIDDPVYESQIIARIM